MSSIVILRIFRNGFVNFWRNIWLSIAASLVMTITLIIFAILIIMFAVTQFSIGTIEERVDISLYLKFGLAQAQIDAMQKELSSNDKIREVSYVSAEEALASFKAKHAGDQLITESLNELNENPLPPTIHVKAKNLEDYPAIAESLKTGKFAAQIDKVNFEDNRAVIQRLSDILTFIIWIGIGLIGIFGFIAILVIFNTITLTIYNRREEVEIMRLVGATNWYIRGPFLVEATLYSLWATGITSLLLIPFYQQALPKISEYVAGGAAQLTNQPVLNPIILIGILLGSSWILSIFSTTMAIRRYLKI